MSCVYILYSESKKGFYIGSSREGMSFTRLQSHNSGKVKSTKPYRPWVLFYEEELSDYTRARQRENFLKSGQGRKWIRERWQSGLMRRS
ncbi:MAG: GIY-YIG nuclease family protein [Candidatus Omnitrophica bacterium]|nr:GIY-YIG nuclease family protein [Candidatus Omnitrophota bacterium]